MFDLLPESARLLLIVSSGVYAGFWLSVLALAGISGVWRRLSMRLRR